MRRALAGLLAAALVVSSFPLPAAAAAGKSAATPVAGAAAPIVPAAVLPGAPAALPPAAVPGAVNLPSVLDAPLAEGTADKGLNPDGTPAAPQPALSLREALEALAAQREPAPAAPLETVVPEAAPANGSERPEADKDMPSASRAETPALAAAPAPAPAAAPAASDEAARNEAAQLFDGQELTEEELASVRPAGLVGFLTRPLQSFKRLKAKTAAAPKVAKPSITDEFGGPKADKRGFWGRVKYGLGWGLNLTAISTLLTYTLKPLVVKSGWVLSLPSGFLEGIGRVELLTWFGPAQIQEAMQEHPYRFLGFWMPLSAFAEEILYRGLAFGLVFLAFTLVKPVTAAISRFIAWLPEINGWGRIFQKGLSALGNVVPRFAFPGAAGLSAWWFMKAHFGTWGIDPFTMAVHLTLGLALAFVAYRSRSLSAPFVAHLTYNLLGLIGTLLAVHFALTGAAVVYGMLVGIASMVYLYFRIRSVLKAKAEARAEAKAGRGPRWALPTLAISLAVMLGLGGSSALETVSPSLAMGQPPAHRMMPAQAPADSFPVIGARIPVPGAPAAAPAPLTGTAELVAKAKPAVVRVIRGNGSGTGFILTPDGLLATNAHVVGDAEPGEQLVVLFAGGRRVAVKVLAVNADKDIAFLQLPINPAGWPTVPLGDSKIIVEGQEVVALGYPLGLPFTATKGIVSGLGNRGNPFIDYLQTDAEINPGNSGGPLLNAAGEVVGMNTAITGRAGIGFSITSADIQRALEQYRASGNINSSWMGIISNETDPLAPKEGVLVEAVRPGSPAAQAGLKAGDIIMAADGTVFAELPADNTALLRQSLAVKKPGETVALIVARGDEVVEISVKLGDKK